MEKRKEKIRIMVPSSQLKIDDEIITREERMVSVEIEVETKPIHLNYDAIRSDLEKSGIHSSRQKDRLIEAMLDGLHNESRMMSLQSFVV